MKLVFDEKTHAYTLGDRKLPSVTEIIRDVGLMGDASKFYDDYSMTRGVFVHQACQMFDDGTLDEDNLDPVLAGYIAAYKCFRTEMFVEWTAIEKPLHDAALGFAGTPDRLAIGTVIDIKTGVKHSWHGVQMAAYALLGFTAGATTLVKRYGLYLNSDGTYKLERYEKKSDFDVFRAALTIYWAKRGNL